MIAEDNQSKHTRLEVEMAFVSAVKAQIHGRIDIDMYSLPSETLGAIFEECVHQIPGQQLVLSAVSSRFRAVALGTPSLWCNVTHFVGRPHQCSRTTAYLHRSKACVLNVSLVVGIGHKDLKTISLEETSTALDLFIPHVSRWQNFHIEGTFGSGMRLCISRLSEAKAPCLTHLEISYMFRADPPPSRVDSAIFSGVSSLSTVHLCGMPMHYCLPPLASVTHLLLQFPLDSDDGVNPLKFASALNGLSCLTHLNIDGDLDYDMQLWSLPTIYLPSLTLLAIHADDEPNQIPVLLAAIRAPSLHFLILQPAESSDQASVFASLMPMQPPKFPSLRSLTICETYLYEFTTRFWKQLMLFLPDITHLTVVLANTVIKALEPGDLSVAGVYVSECWESLRMLTLSEKEDAEEVGTEQLCTMLGRRREAGYPIRRLRITNPGHMTKVADVVGHVEVCERLDPNVVDAWLDEQALYPYGC